MDRVLLFAACLCGVLATVNGGGACYYCSASYINGVVQGAGGGYSPACGDPFDPPGAASFSSSCDGMCMKVVSTIGGAKTIVRSCASNSLGYACTPLNSNGVVTTCCDPSQNNKCNDGATVIASAALVGLSLGAFFAAKLAL